MASNACGHDWVVTITQQEEEPELDSALINAVAELGEFTRFAIYINKTFNIGLPARLLNKNTAIEELSEHEVLDLLAKVSGNKEYGEEALKNIHWAITKQSENGWFDDCCLDQPDSPLTHTLGYVTRGILEGYLYSRDECLLQSALKLAGAITTLVDDEGYLPGRWYKDWTPAVSWVCLTGAVQIAHSLLIIYKETGHDKFLNTALKLNKYVRRTVRLSGENEAMVGGIRGSYPIDGLYGRYEYLNWAAKFFIDSNMLEAEILAEDLRA